MHLDLEFVCRVAACCSLLFLLLSFAVNELLHQSAPNLKIRTITTRYIRAQSMPSCVDMIYTEQAVVSGTETRFDRFSNLVSSVSRVRATL